MDIHCNDRGLLSIQRVVIRNYFQIIEFKFVYLIIEVSRLTPDKMDISLIATQQEVETLKLKWVNQPTFDLSALSSPEVGERYAPFREELRAFQEKMELTWAQAAAVKQHSPESGITAGPSTQFLDAIYQQVLAEEALQRYLHIVLPQLPDDVRADLSKLIKTMVETAIRFTEAEHRRATVRTGYFPVNSDSESM